MCTHTMGSAWKQAFGAAPWWAKKVMDNGEVGKKRGGRGGRKQKGEVVE